MDSYRLSHHRRLWPGLTTGTVGGPTVSPMRPHGLTTRTVGLTHETYAVNFQITDITDPGGRLMGKRSNFERREADFYPTPRAAVVPLIPYLRGIRTFAEPCAGDGALVRHLESFGLRCVYGGDIRDGQDALELDHYGGPIPSLRIRPTPRPDAPADRALPEHRADLAAAGCGLGTHQAGCAVPAPLLGHRGDRPREMDRGFKVHRQGQLRLVQVRHQAHGWPRLPRARQGRSLFDAPESASNAARLTSHSDRARGSVRRRAGSAPIATGLA